MFKHVGQVSYSRGFKFGEKGPIKVFGPFLPTGPALLNFIKILSLFNTQPNRPRASPAMFKHVGQVSYSRGFKFGEKGPIKVFGPFLPTGPALLNFIKILSLFNTQANRHRASPAIFKHVGQVPYSRASNLGKRGRSKFWPILPTGPALLNFIKILTLFNTQPHRPRASPAIIKHVGQVPYSRGFKFGERGRSKFWSLFAYRSGAVEFHQNFKSFQHTT